MALVQKPDRSPAHTTQTKPLQFTDPNAVFVTELWDPDTGNFTLMSPVAIARVYHSIALLLPDGRVFSGGGGLCRPDPCPCELSYRLT